VQRRRLNVDGHIVPELVTFAQRLGDVGRTDMEPTWDTAATRIGLALDVARGRM